MSHHEVHTPDVLPVLSRGKHRSPRKGACFMELASYLAGERWSDHPACTHPLLASLARHVNDHTSDAARPRLAALIPSVIGLTSDDPRVDAHLALLCARTALPVASEERQRVLAVALLTGERVLAELEGRPGRPLSDETLAAFEAVPGAARWARRFAHLSRTTPRAHRRHAAPHVVGYAVHGIAHACTADPDALLHDLLAAAVDDVSAWVGRERLGVGAPRAAGATVDVTSWAAACELTGAAAGR